MLKAIFNWFTGRPDPKAEAPAVKPEAAPYKVEPPPVVQAVAPAPVSDHVRVEATAPAAKKPRVRKPAAVAKPAKITAKPRKK